MIDRTDAGSAVKDAPDDFSLDTRLPVIPVGGTVIFPYVVIPLALTDGALVRAVQAAVGGEGLLVLLSLRPGRLPHEDPSAGAGSPFYDVGTLGRVVQLLPANDESTRALVQAVTRVDVATPLREDGVWTVQASARPDQPVGGPRSAELRATVVEAFEALLALAPDVPADTREAIAGVSDCGQLADLAAANLTLPADEKQALLEERDVLRRLEGVLEGLRREKHVRQLGTDLQEKVKGEVDRTQREYWLREQLKAIRSELGEGEESDLAELRRKLELAAMPAPARQQAEREVRRLERTPPQAPDYHIIRDYLQWLAEMPWSREEAAPVELERARRVLDRDHYDLTAVKERIVEYLAVHKLNPGPHGPILCLVGPPGVGKTSLGRSIADALGRRFARISLGGVADEAEIRGHRRTYVGAMPGRIVQAIREAGARDAVVLLDEVDKLTRDIRGDPAAALLEVLDPAQNHTFTDHYLDVEFDLSRVLFIGTANELSPVAPALVDRLEVLELPGYTDPEKLEIARRFLIPRQRSEAGLAEDQVVIADAAVRALITDHTREAGVRELERQLARILRKVALRVVEGRARLPVTVEPANLDDFVGKARFAEELAGRAHEVGTATALAYTAAGGQILFVEAVSMPGSGEVKLTGHLGDVMRESAHAAMSYLRAHAEQLHIPPERFRDKDVHIHVPAGATPKDGPSAGVAMAVALASLFTGRPVRCDVAMTGEITLRGHVLAVGGIKEKILAACRAGIRSVLLPRRNEADLAELPDEVRRDLVFELVDDVNDAFERALVERRTTPRDGRAAASGTAGRRHGQWYDPR